MDVWRSMAVFQLPRQLNNRPLFWSRVAILCNICSLSWWYQHWYKYAMFEKVIPNYITSWAPQPPYSYVYLTPELYSFQFFRRKALCSEHYLFTLCILVGNWDWHKINISIGLVSAVTHKSVTFTHSVHNRTKPKHHHGLAGKLTFAVLG